MSNQIKNPLLFYILLITIIISSSLDTEIEENQYVKAVISTNKQRFILFIDEPKDQIMSVEFIFSNPSKYEKITFNKYIEEETNNTQNINLENISMRRLLTDYSENGTNLVIDDGIINGKNVVFLKVDNETDKIIFTVFKVNYKPVTNADYIFLKHRVSKEKPIFYYTKNLNLNYELNKDIVNVSFSGISQYENVENNENFQAVFIIKLFDKKNIDNMIEDPKTYFLLISTSPLKEENIKLNGTEVSKDINLRIIAPLNNNLSQYMIIYAIASFKNETEYIFYDHKEFLIEEESKEEEENEEEKEEEEEEKEKEKENNKMSEEKIREKNLIKFFIIMGSFVGIVVIVFIGIMINIACKTKVIEDDSDDEEYKNVGVIRDVGNEEEN